MKGEACKPIPVRYTGRWSFRFRCLLDLQLATIVKGIEPALGAMRGSVLDVGCGDMPFRHMLRGDVEYVGLDVPRSSEFGMRPDSGVVCFDGRAIPFEDDRFDNVICTEVLEHSDAHETLIAEMHRVLKPGGRIVLTVPFAARVHHGPYDFHRFTAFQIARLFTAFTDVRIEPRGNDVAVIANKLVTLTLRLLSGATIPLAIALGPITALFLLLGNLSIRWGFGSTDDPLGYTVIGRK